MPTLHYRLKNQISALNDIAVHLESMAAQWFIPARVIREINLVLEELFTNIVLYAYSDDAEHLIDLDFTLADRQVLHIRIEDDGMPFNLLEKKVNDFFSKPIEQRQVGGLGIHFVREMMNCVEYRREDEKNIVILTKNFSPST